MADPIAIALFAHPDDEIGLFPWLSGALADGRRVLCVWLTDGGWGGQSIERRCAESRAVLSPMGIGLDDMSFAGIELSIPDGELHRRMDDAVKWLLRRFPKLDAATPLWIPAWEGGHPDHDASHLAGLALAQATGVTPWQYSLYHGEGLPGPLFRVITPLADNGPSRAIAVSLAERIRCVRRCLAYRSQWKSFVGLLPFYAMRMLHPSPFVLQRADWKRTAHKPHAGAMLYERRGMLGWDAFALSTSRWRARD